MTKQHIKNRNTSWINDFTQHLLHFTRTMKHMAKKKNTKN